MVLPFSEALADQVGGLVLNTGSATPYNVLKVVLKQEVVAIKREPQEPMPLKDAARSPPTKGDTAQDWTIARQPMAWNLNASGEGGLRHREASMGPASSEEAPFSDQLKIPLAAAVSCKVPRSPCRVAGAGGHHQNPAR